MTAHDPSREPGYGDVETAARRDDLLEVSFANGDVVTLDPNTLGIIGEFAASVADGGAAVFIDSLAGRREVDWMVVRAATDPAFAQYLRERDGEEARRIGRRLRALRENRGMSQKMVASAADMPAPQLAKLEQGETDMRISTLRSLLRALGAEFADIAGPDAPEISAREVSKRAQRVGVPADVMKQLAEAVDPRELLDLVVRAFRWLPEAVLGDQLTTPVLTTPPVLKRQSTTSKDNSALLALAEALATRSALAFEGTPGVVPSDPGELRELVAGSEPAISLDALLRWCWQEGIVVAPMAAKGGFSAGVWMIARQPVVVLKESPNYKPQWLFALAHELGHLANGHVGPGGLVDVEPVWKGRDDEQEAVANQYALDLLVPEHDEMLAEIREQLHGLDPDASLKFKAMDAARKRGYDEALVLLVAAFGLPDLARDDSRWGSAINEAKKQGSAREAVAAQYAQHIDLDRLDRLDVALIRALAVPG
jgi:transcriptional regulator with XRE-family HTH domain